MSEYLSKEEIKQWRSSLEKITLEEFAARLGKQIEPAKPTNDLVDIVLQGKPVVTNETEYKQSYPERLSSIAERAYEREQLIAPTPFSVRSIQKEEKKKSGVEIKKTVSKKTAKSTKNNVKKQPVKSVKKALKKDDIREELKIVFKKALTDREQKVFDHFSDNRGKVVYAKDLAVLLDLPRDYVYKYIKNLRAKIDGDRLENADKGGFILNI